MEDLRTLRDEKEAALNSGDAVSPDTSELRPGTSYFVYGAVCCRLPFVCSFSQQNCKVGQAKAMFRQFFGREPDGNVCTSASKCASEEGMFASLYNVSLSQRFPKFIFRQNLSNSADNCSRRQAEILAHTSYPNCLIPSLLQASLCLDMLDLPRRSRKLNRTFRWQPNFPNSVWNPAPLSACVLP